MPTPESRTQPPAQGPEESRPERSSGSEADQGLRTLQRELRRSGRLEQALAEAKRLSARAPHDRRALVRLVHASLALQRPADADLALDGLAELSLSRGLRRDAVRFMLRRASLLAGNGGNATPLAARALELSMSAGDVQGVFLARQLLAVLLVRRGELASAHEALDAYLRAAVRAKRETQALSAISQLAVGSGTGAGVAARLLGVRALAHGEHEVAARWLLEAIRRLPEDSGPEAQLLGLIFERGLWMELATLYRLKADAAEATARVLPLEQLAELWEDELQNLPAALDTYEEALASGAGVGSLREVIRLSAAAGTVPRAVAALRKHHPGPLSEGLTLFEQVAQSDLPPAARAELLETVAELCRRELGEGIRADSALAKATALRQRK